MRVSALTLLVVFAGCAALTPRDLDAPVPTLTTAEDLVTYLGRRGVILHPDRLVTSPFIDATGHQYRIDGGGTLQVFEFADPAAAEAGAADYVRATAGGEPVRLFQRGTLVAAHYGGATTAVSALTDALGPAVY